MKTGTEFAPIEDAVKAYIKDDEKAKVQEISSKILDLRKQIKKDTEHKKELIDVFMKPFFSPDRAKDISEMLFLKRLSLRKNKTAIAIYAIFSQYYDNNTHSNLIFGK
jgi:hypothetical protein